MKRRDFFGSVIGLTLAGKEWLAAPPPTLRPPRNNIERAKRFIRALEADHSILGKFNMVATIGEPGQYAARRQFVMPLLSHRRVGVSALEFVGTMFPNQAITTCEAFLYDDEGYLLHSENHKPVRLIAGDTLKYTMSINL